MLKLNEDGLYDRAGWEAAGVRMPCYDRNKMCRQTEENPIWIHFGAGNIFRGFIAELQHQLLNKGLSEYGILAADTYDYDNIDQIYCKHDALTLLVLLLPDGSVKTEVIASVCRGLKIGSAFPEDVRQLKNAFCSSSLQMVSFTITEKGYALKNMKNEVWEDIQQDFERGPESCTEHANTMTVIAAMLWERYNSCRKPLALVSMDNCSHNGEKLRNAILTIAEEWYQRGFVQADFISWLEDEEQVSFPWSMIDKITPRPSAAIAEKLMDAGISGMNPIVTSHNTYAAPFVNAEVPQYLVIEDRFPNGRPPLEMAGVYFTDRNTVNLTEKMKVTACLNPLHTALAVYGCLLRYHSIAAEMKDPELVKLIYKIGYQEGLPVVADPKIICPEEFMAEVIEKRLPNPFIPDTPQRIATDTSQKIAIRFGETIKSYMKRPGLDASDLQYIPLVLAGWLRYLLSADDNGAEMSCSADPMLAILQKQLGGIIFGQPETASDEVLRPILSNQMVFGVNLYEAGLAGKVKGFLQEMLAGPQAVRSCLKKYLA